MIFLFQTITNIFCQKMKEKHQSPINLFQSWSNSRVSVVHPSVHMQCYFNFLINQLSSSIDFHLVNQLFMSLAQCIATFKTFCLVILLLTLKLILMESHSSVMLVHFPLNTRDRQMENYRGGQSWWTIIQTEDTLQTLYSRLTRIMGKFWTQIFLICYC